MHIDRGMYVYHFKDGSGIGFDEIEPDDNFKVGEEYNDGIIVAVLELGSKTARLVQAFEALRLVTPDDPVTDTLSALLQEVVAGYNQVKDQIAALK